LILQPVNDNGQFMRPVIVNRFATPAIKHSRPIHSCDTFRASCGRQNYCHWL